VSNWDASDARQLAEMLVGDHFGQDPEKNLELIREAKRERARYLAQQIGWHGDSVVLEVGSGMGLTSRHVATMVKRLYCSDISASFLDIARRECAGIDNIEFIWIEHEPAEFAFEDGYFDTVFSDAVFIHLNIYDIYWYFSEFQRLVKPQGKVFINIMNASNIELPKLSQMAGFYRKDVTSLKRLLSWHSIDAVRTIAAHFGFRLQSKGGRLLRLKQPLSVDLLFVRQ
jgi:ubiquinone/menaquinone biosynthesis C-methylase UbiE